MNGFSKILALIFVFLCLGAGVGVFWYYKGNMKTNDEIIKNDEVVDKGAANLMPPKNNEQAGPTTVVKNGMHLVTLKTSMGEIAFETYDADAPKTVNNFITLSKKGFYDNVIFHRVIKGFMIQGGDPLGTGTGGPGYTFADELNPATDSYKAGYKKGVVAMANAGPNTNGSQFFIMLADYPLQKNYSIFGKVIKGQEIVDKIGSLPTNPQDRPNTPPVIKSITVENR